MEAGAFGLYTLFEHGLQLGNDRVLLLENFGRQYSQLLAHFGVALPDEFESAADQADIPVIKTLPVEVVEWFGGECRIVELRGENQMQLRHASPDFFGKAKARLYQFCCDCGRRRQGEIQVINFRGSRSAQLGFRTSALDNAPVEFVQILACLLPGIAFVRYKSVQDSDDGSFAVLCAGIADIRQMERHG